MDNSCFPWASQCTARVNLHYVDSTTLTEKNVVDILSKSDGVLVPGGFGSRGIEGKIIVLCSPFLRANEQEASEDDHFADLIETIKPSIVAVGTYYFNAIPKISYLGTGFVISGGKRLVTNFHVISGVIEKKELPFLRIFHKNLPLKGIKIKIIAIDKFHDLAILGNRHLIPSHFQVLIPSQGQAYLSSH